jgi:hypothetical protein
MQRAIVTGLRTVVVGTTGALHWSEHFRRKHERRRDDAAALISAIPATVVIVAAHKACLPQGAAMGNDTAVFYNYAYRLLLERVAYLARDWPGGPRLAIVRADSVKGMKHGESLAYLEHVKRHGGIYSRYPVPWHTLNWPPTWHASREFDGLQLADLFASTLGVGLNQNDPTWLIPWAPRMRAFGSRNVWRRGFKVLTGCTCLQGSWGGSLDGTNP